MMTTVAVPVYLIVLANAALIVAATFAMFRFDRLLRASRDDANRAQRSNVEVVGGTASGASQVQIMATLAALQRSVNELQQRELPPAQSQVIDLSLEHAVRMAKRGAAATELSRDCGLNEGEAELLCRLHGPLRNPAPIAKASMAQSPIAQSPIAEGA